MIKGILIIEVLCTAILVLILCLYRGRTKDLYLQELEDEEQMAWLSEYTKRKGKTKNRIDWEEENDG